MGKKLKDILKGAAVMGLFAGLFSLTGQHLDPMSLITGLCDVLVGAASGHLSGDLLALWGDIKLGLLIYSTITLIVFIVSVLYCGGRGLLTAACGYLGMVFLVTGLPGLQHGLSVLYLPALLLVAGVLVAEYVPDRGRIKLG